MGRAACPESSRAAASATAARRAVTPWVSLIRTRKDCMSSRQHLAEFSLFVRIIKLPRPSRLPARTVFLHQVRSTTQHLFLPIQGNEYTCSQSTTRDPRSFWIVLPNTESDKRAPSNGYPVFFFFNPKTSVYPS